MIYIFAKWISKKGLAMEQFKVTKWGNSLAVRLPSSMVKRLRLEVGESIPAGLVIGSDELRTQLEAERMAKMMTREEATTRIRERWKTLSPVPPEDWKIDRNSDDMRG